MLANFITKKKIQITQIRKIEGASINLNYLTSLIAIFLVSNIYAQNTNLKDDWIQYPPKAAVKLTNQLTKLKEISNERKEESTKNKDILEPDLQQLPLKPLDKTLVQEDVKWANDHKRKTIELKFSDGTVEKRDEIVEPIAGEPSYKGNLQMIPMSYGDGVRSIITRKAKSEEIKWAKDHTTKTTIYTFSDGTSNLEIKSIPKKYSEPKFRGSTEIVTITYGDGFEKIEENQPNDKKEVWSTDHLSQTITYLYEDGKTLEEYKKTERISGTPSYQGPEERITYEYGDGYTEEIIYKAIDEKINWASDHLTKTQTFYFADGTKNEVISKLEKKLESTSYNAGVETIIYSYPDGILTEINKKAISESITWSNDHIHKTTEYLFADGTVNRVISMVPKLLSKPTYKGNLQFFKVKYGDGFNETIVNKAIDKQISWSEDHQYKTTLYKFEDLSTNQEVDSIPNKLSTPVYKSNKEIVERVFGDGTKKTYVYDAIEEKETWSKDYSKKIIIYKFADGTTHKEEIAFTSIVEKPKYENDTELITLNFIDGTSKVIKKKAFDTKISTKDDGTYIKTYYFEDGTSNQVPISLNDSARNVSELNKPVISSNKLEQPESSDKKGVIKKINSPVYLNGLQIITMTDQDGKVITQTHKAISKEESFSKDKKTRYTSYRFEDGSINKVSNSVDEYASQKPLPSFSDSNEDLTNHFLADN